MTHSAIDWKIILVANWCVYRENMIDQKWLFCPDSMIGKGAWGNWTWLPWLMGIWNGTLLRKGPSKSRYFYFYINRFRERLWPLLILCNLCCTWMSIAVFQGPSFHGKIFTIQAHIQQKKNNWQATMFRCATSGRNALITQFDKKKVIFCPHVLMVIFPFLGGKNDGKWLS